jgi:hypothetical protein
MSSVWRDGCRAQLTTKSEAEMRLKDARRMDWEVRTTTPILVGLGAQFLGYMRDASLKTRNQDTRCGA